MKKDYEVSIKLKDSIPDDDGSGFILITRRQLMMTKLQNIIIFIILFIGTAYLFFQISMMLGSLKERESKQCVDAHAMKQWEDTMSLTKSICVDIQSNQLEEIKNNYQKINDKSEEDAEYWRNAYFWLKSQNATPTETN